MARTFFTSFRSAEGRSLARALAVLLVISGCLGAVHSGRMAEIAVSGSVVCSVNGTGLLDSGGRALPSVADHCICCASGCSWAAGCVLSGTGGRLALVLSEIDAADLVQTAFFPAATRLLNVGPRDPPVLT